MIDATGSVTSAAQQQQPAAPPQSALGEQAFLQLLVTQIKQQDPMNPMDNTTFVTQLAQFSSLEQLTSMSSQLGKLNNSSAISMIGKQVAYTTTDASGKPSSASGTVSGVNLQSGTPELIVGNTSVPLSSIVEVAGAPAAQ